MSEEPVSDTMDEKQSANPFAPLGVPSFRNIWTASLFSNFGQLVLAVGAAWEMTRLTPEADMVALVQSAVMLPLMLVAVPAGAIADMFDRRLVAISGLTFSSICAAILAILSFSGLLTPWVLLGFCSLIGVGVALYSPSWQASIPEQVPASILPSAVALGSISYNVARSVGPAIGGLIVMAFGARVTFAMNATLFLPLILAFILWKRNKISSRLPPENFWRAIISGARYTWNSANIRIVYVRVILFSLFGASFIALGPLVAKTLLNGNAATYGILLGGMGIGAVSGALLVGKVSAMMRKEHAVQINALVTGAALILIGFSPYFFLTLACVFFIGFSNVMTTSMFTVAVQLSAPRWVLARAMSIYMACLTGGVAIGAWLWGELAADMGVSTALWCSGAMCAATALVGFFFPISQKKTSELDPIEIGYEPEVELAITTRSGPIIVQIEYDVDPERARDFYEVMQRVHQLRNRNGGFNWSLARDIADPAAWTERYSCPTWGDYLRMRDRWTEADKALQLEADDFHRGSKENRVRRKLERPMGSVRWRSDTPDPNQDHIGIITP